MTERAVPSGAADPGVPVLAVEGLRVRYPGAGRDALAGVSFGVRPGELVALLGLNGAGKSTLCRCLNGIVPGLVEAEVEGRVVVDGTDVRSVPVRRLARLVGVVLDEPRAQLSAATAGEEVALGLEALAVPHPEMVRRVDEALARVGLAGLAGRSPGTLSGGEQQRLLIAAVIAMRPRVLVLDEPTAGLDPRGREAVLALLAGLAERDGVAVLVVDHDVELLAAWAHRVLVLAEGRLVADGEPRRVLGDVVRMAGAGVRVPDVTAVAAAVDAAAAGEAVVRPTGARATPGDLPVTLESGIRWLADRG